MDGIYNAADDTLDSTDAAGGGNVLNGADAAEASGESSGADAAGGAGECAIAGGSCDDGLSLSSAFRLATSASNS